MEESFWRRLWTCHQTEYWINNCHKLQELGASQWPRRAKEVTWISSLHLSQQEKFKDSTFHCTLSCLELQREHSPEMRGQSHDNQLQDLCKPHKSIMSTGERSWCFFNMITTDSTQVLPLVWQQTALNLKLFYTLSTAKIWHCWLWLSRNSSMQSLHMWQSSTGCHRNMVTSTAWSILLWLVQKTCSVLVM